MMSVHAEGQSRIHISTMTESSLLLRNLCGGDNTPNLYKARRGYLGTGALPDMSLFSSARAASWRVLLTASLEASK